MFFFPPKPSLLLEWCSTVRRTLRSLCCLQEYLVIWRCSHSKPSSSANSLSDSCTSLLFFNRAFFSLMLNSIFSKSSTDLIASICIWKVLLTSGLLVGLICSFRNEILSSMIRCRVIIANRRTSEETDGRLLKQLASLGEGG